MIFFLFAVGAVPFLFYNFFRQLLVLYSLASYVRGLKDDNCKELNDKSSILYTQRLGSFLDSDVLNDDSHVEFMRQIAKQYRSRVHKLLLFCFISACLGHIITVVM